MAKCERCDKEIGRPLRSGPSPRFCSGRCRVAAHRARQLPAELRTRDRWVRWTPDKRPATAEGWPASVADPRTWSSYKEIRQYPRIGYVLGQGIGCIDLDHCLDEDGKPTPEALAFLETLPATYIEISPSGDGLHVWGLLPEAPGTRRKVGGLSIETYSRRRYITVTGRRFANSPPRLADLSHLS